MTPLNEHPVEDERTAIPPAVAPAAIFPPAPLAVWRQTSAVDRETLWRLSALLDGVHVLHEPRWRKALGADVAAAIGIAMRNLIPGPNGGLGLLDVAMSAVLIHAARGNATAQIVLEHGRKCL